MHNIVGTLHYFYIPRCERRPSDARWPACTTAATEGCWWRTTWTCACAACCARISATCNHTETGRLRLSLYARVRGRRVSRDWPFNRSVFFSPSFLKFAFPPPSHPPVIVYSFVGRDLSRPGNTWAQYKTFEILIAKHNDRSLSFHRMYFINLAP